jgi:hypothetical protein
VPPRPGATSPDPNPVEEDADAWWRRAAVDTSVIISEHRHWLWLAARYDLIEGIWSVYIAAEAARIWTEKSIARNVPRLVYRAQVNALVNALSDVLTCVDYRKS